jgi:hypothetical protein
MRQRGGLEAAFRSGNYAQAFMMQTQLLRAKAQLREDSLKTLQSPANFQSVIFDIDFPKTRNEIGTELPFKMLRGAPPQSLDELGNPEKGREVSNFRVYALRAALFCRHCTEKARTLQ